MSWHAGERFLPVGGSGIQALRPASTGTPDCLLFRRIKDTERAKRKMHFRIVEGPDKMNIEDITRLLKMTYWADKRSPETIEKAVSHSSCYGVYVDGSENLAGFARVISDDATAYYLCDVIIDPVYQHNGLGTALVSHIVTSPEYAGLRGFLITRDAHDLYRKFGFEVVDGRVMVKSPD